MTDVRAAPIPRYRKEWLVSVVVLAALATFLWWRQTHARQTQLTPIAVTNALSGVDWFQMVRFPELPREGAEATARLQQLENWVAALRQSGFQIRPFAEVVAALNRGELLPERTLVIVFEPAYRKTIEQVLEPFERLQCPVLWITFSPGFYRTDRRFVPKRTRRSLAETQLWDFGLCESTNEFTLEEDGAYQLGRPKFSWGVNTGDSGFNRGLPESGLNRLHGNIAWSGDELVNRLKADLPLRSPCRLNVSTIQGRYWGIVNEDVSDPSFDLSASLDRRFATVSWFGARGVNDLEIDLKVESYLGEFSLFLRSDPERRERIRLSVEQDRLRVWEESGESTQTGHECLLPTPDSGELSVRISARGDTLVVKDANGQILLKAEVGIRGTPTSIIQMAVHHRIHGAAYARGITAEVTALDRVTHE